MTTEYRVTIRLAPDLYAQLEARGSQGQPLAAIVRDALEQYLARQPVPPPLAVTAARAGSGSRTAARTVTAARAGCHVCHV
jgi:hypothetical protein